MLRQWQKQLKNRSINMGIVLVIESTIEILVCFYLNFKQIAWATWGDRISFVTSLLAGFALLKLLLFIVQKVAFISPEDALDLEDEEV
mmetsp:Transcript_41718/g.63741  ORF Transcript_41718/g.63741 Transcript_41718/m.63741 type:complete len:88 (-) Transcript_41718:1128-1391(-)